jgi:hypothetical protein
MTHQHQETREYRKALPKPDQLRAFYFYTRDVDKRPIHTHCFITDSTGKRYARGQATCSPWDEPNKEAGRRLAYRRALNGYYEQANVLGTTPWGNSLYKTMVGHPLSARELKFVAAAREGADLPDEVA